MDSCNCALLDAWENLEFGHHASWLATKPFIPFSLLPLIKPQEVHHIGRSKFSDNQLHYVLVNSVHARGTNTTRDIVLVLRYKWPSQFRLLLESDLDTVLWYVYPDYEAMLPSHKVEGIQDSMFYLPPLDPEGGWRRFRERRWYIARLPEMTQLVNTFKIELREAEICNIRALAKSIEPQVVQIILANKLFSDLSSADIALGLTNRYSNLVRDHRYVWIVPFTELHVETVWYSSQLAQTISFKMVAEEKRQQMGMRNFLMAFMRDVVAGRADETLGLDPRSRGNEESAASLVEEVIILFLGCVEAEIPWGPIN